MRIPAGNVQPGHARRLRRVLRVGVMLTVAILLLLWGGFEAAVAWWPYPQALDAPPIPSTRIDDRHGKALAMIVSRQGQWCFPLTADQISPHLLDAMVAAEDRRFYSHHGIDWQSVAGAAWEDLIHLSPRRGASTITMQLQHLRDQEPRTLLAKLRQAIRARQLEQRLGKREILVEYLNRAPFGGNLQGAGAASWRYFGRPCRDLSLAQAAMLAGLPRSPNRFRPDRYPLAALTRRNQVLGRMRACNLITQKQEQDAMGEPLDASWRPLPQERKATDLPPADGALPALVKLTSDNRGARIRTTLDAHIQRQAAQATIEHLHSLENQGITAAAVVVLDSQSSQCLATVSIGPAGMSIDLTTRPRSTGSTLKPFIYAAAFDAGVCSPHSMLSDSPAAWAGYAPNDYDRSFLGNLSAAEALAQSRNLPAMQVLARTGVQTTIGVMDATGLHRLAQSPERYGVALAIGGAEASPMELAQAYAALARGGIAKPVRLLAQPDFAYPTPRLLREQACWQTLAALADSQRTASICPAAVRSHVAWKTGTSSGHHDAWCAAVTRRDTVVVWVGNAGGEGSAELVGQDAAAPLALRIIALLDPADDPWPIAPHELPITVAQSDPSRKLVLVHPAPDQQFVLAADLPPQRQRIALQAMLSGPGARSILYWFVDDALVGTGPPGTTIWCSPLPGRHQVRVVDETGNSASTDFRVSEAAR